MSGRDIVLIVDDEEDCREECALVVNQMGIETQEAGSAMEAMRILEDVPRIGIVMTDVRMPGIDGISFIGKAQDRFGPSRNLDFIVLTGHGSMDLAVSAMRYRVVDFLNKPIGRREIMDAIERARSGRGRGGQAGGDVGIETLSHQVQQIARTLASMSPERLDGGRAAQPAATAATPLDAPFVRNLIKLRRLRDNFLPAELFADPAWDILLDLTAATLEGKETSVSSLCLASAVPPTTALRWVKTMSEAGLLERKPDDQDGRRILVSITPAAQEAMMQCLTQIRTKLKH